MKCPKCEGEGFIELEHGLIMMECDECGGTKEVDDNSGIKQADSDIGSAGTGQPEQSSKSKTKKTARKRAK